MSLNTLFTLYAALVGLMTGSYLNVVIHRLPAGVSTVLPRSRCPVCGSPIRAFDNVPVLSFLLLRGRCRECRTPIGWRYPLVEALTAFLFVTAYRRFGLGAGGLAPTLVAILFCCLMVVLAGIDLDHLILPDRLTLPGIAIGLLLQPWAPWSTWGEALVGAAAGALALLAVRIAWRVLRDVEAMGLGDVKMMAMIGAFLGWKGALVSLVLAVTAGAVLGLGLIALGRSDLQYKIPFGPFLAAGAVVSLLAGGGLLLERYLAFALP